MTQSIGINASNDMFIGADGNLVIRTGELAVEDACKNASQMRLGEAVLQTGLGLPMFESIFNGIPKPAIYENALRQTLEAVDGVIKVTVLEIIARKNTFAYTATIESVYGKTFTMNG